MPLKKNQVRVTRTVEVEKDFVITIDMEEVLDQIKQQIPDIDSNYFDIAEITLYDVLSEEEVN